LLGGLGLALALGVTGGCGTPCEQLNEFVCDGGDAAYCAQVADFIKEQQVDADGDPLDAAASTESCRYIMGNVEIQNAYRFKAKERFLGEPYWQVLKNMKPDERAAWRERNGIPEPTPVETPATTKPADAVSAGAPADGKSKAGPGVTAPGASAPAKGAAPAKGVVPGAEPASKWGRVP